MNKLSIELQTQVVKALCEVNSIVDTARMTRVAINNCLQIS
ncbi:MAG: hypothetical protein HW384_521 [Dehalococcoidia bacterium]|nr:hypothetical protein [Dehalococcoidia bacterium]